MFNFKFLSVLSLPSLIFVLLAPALFSNFPVQSMEQTNDKPYVELETLMSLLQELVDDITPPEAERFIDKGLHFERPFNDFGLTVLDGPEVGTLSSPKMREKLRTKTLQNTEELSDYFLKLAASIKLTSRGKLADYNVHEAKVKDAKLYSDTIQFQGKSLTSNAYAILLTLITELDKLQESGQESPEFIKNYEVTHEALTNCFQKTGINKKLTDEFVMYSQQLTEPKAEILESIFTLAIHEKKIDTNWLFAEMKKFVNKKANWGTANEKWLTK